MKQGWLGGRLGLAITWFLGIGWLLPATPAMGQAADLALTSGTRALPVEVGQSRTVLVPWRVKGVALGEPKIADVQMLQPDRIMVLGKMPGVTDLVLWDDAQQTRHVRVEVDPDLEKLQRDIATLFPNSKLQIAHSQGVYMLTGTVNGAAEADQIQKLLEQMGVKFVNLAHLPGPQQVRLRVRVAELNRTAIRALTVNAIKTGDDFFGGLLVGPSNGGALNPVSIGPLKGAPVRGIPKGVNGGTPFGFPEDVLTSPLVTLLAGFPNSDLEFFIQALAENQYLKILAEPTLIALSGEEAHFLAGGEFPIPVVQGSTSGGISITVEYKEFGVQLSFLPTVLGDGAIRIKVAPEVSDLSDIGAVEIEGFRVPSVLTRRAETTLEMKSGQTFAIAGLLNQVARARNSRIPGLGDIPFIGALFRSTRHDESDAELLVLVRAELVEPLTVAQEPPLPGETSHAPSDWEFYAKGRLEAEGAQNMAPETAEWVRQHGWDRLKGPGAWARHDEAAPPAPPAVPRSR